MHTILDTEITYLPGVGPKKAALLNEELGIQTFADLLFHFPYRYIDRSKFYKISELHKDLPYIQVKGKFTHFETSSIGKGRKKLTGYFGDETGIVEIIWFQSTNWIQSSLKKTSEYVIFGKPTSFGNQINIVHPDIEDYNKWQNKLVNALYPQYSSTEKLNQSYLNSKAIQKLVDTLLKKVKGQIYETLPVYLRTQYNLKSLEESLFEIHFPTSVAILNQAQYRIKFEELFYIQLNLIQAKQRRKESSVGFVFDRSNDKLVKECFFRKIPFDLTNAQTRVLQEIRQDLISGKQMNRLLQGDVGSGKTLVALLTALIAIDNGYQACIMAPTEILAQQHYRSISKFLDGLDVNIDLLTGSVKKKARTRIHEQLVSGKLNLLIGTHAVIEDTVVFNNLGMVVIDEQHRFGVEQRAKLWKKNNLPPHIMIMTATPIPRTLAMTLYGDLDVSVIDELPPGRTKIITKHFKDSDRLRVFGFIKKQIALGRQTYVVFPLISESENMDYKDLEDGVEGYSRAFPIPDYQISVLHGRMKPDQKEISMNIFEKGQTDIMIATTVVEVGVDVPNASLMIIESAERFGLSQLHQLRGRVGRGSDQSYCFLMTGEKLSESAYNRILCMVNSTDGFEIAETDLKLRGPGDLEGKQQSGFTFDLKMANLSRDGQLLQYVKDIATEILEKDPELTESENHVLAVQLKEQNKGKIDFSKIS
ncbi:MAG: ATP-dependent DNA helicase RecG [Bacteroidales bacterium]|nr:ATP-dependent DNA helicase RecG [Bacteroidales bacterium]MDD4216550.1 ATP-dependent DNA helicase RecG [Bacteroidales bacterium]MDY0141373.1 ATP-dependent DNA helicase RecG [Bacteroidales bacterium]